MIIKVIGGSFTSTDKVKLDSAIFTPVLCTFYITKDIKILDDCNVSSTHPETKRPQ